jgi:hypothetical protein
MNKVLPASVMEAFLEPGSGRSATVRSEHY